VTNNIQKTRGILLIENKRNSIDKLANKRTSKIEQI
jgi:hypothetical protein